MAYDLVTLALFRSVAASGSIAHAAALHGLVPSAVSKRMADLEVEVGAALLQRHRRGVDLTAAGKDLLRHAEALRDAVDRMEAEMGAHATGRRGAIRVAANSSSISQFLPEDLAEFVAAHPDLSVHLTEMTSVEVIEAVRAGRADLGIYSGLTEGSGLTLMPYRRDTLVVVMPSDHALATRQALRLADVVNEPFVALQTGSSIQTWLDRRAEEIGTRILRQVAVQSFDGVRRMVQARLGIAVLPFGAVEPYLDSTRLAMVPLDEPWATRELVLAVRDPGAISPQTACLIATLRGQAE
ncbi:LysR family transcriptional regulator [Roseicyclus mahoneyensis]|jgi:DNA-binding transcriptional LysR family regulator|uniref:LysR family transcriptional regulator n=1 Tax=Roseicyclus mahoneyensis TaxID=164332 RepID=A0A316GPQ2_9RHOB|nr:LysR family transcriptional regulator [Roseicyclus mahoneyensis]PWK61494.1 LysR family transcriptional regulator [Roseicyclus mahoneyensis]